MWAWTRPKAWTNLPLNLSPSASRPAGPPAPSTFLGLPFCSAFCFWVVLGSWLEICGPQCLAAASTLGRGRVGVELQPPRVRLPLPPWRGPIWGTHPECSDMSWKSLPTLCQAKGPRGGGAAVWCLRSALQGPRTRVSFREGQRQRGRKSAPSSSQAPRPGPPHQTRSLVMISLRGLLSGGSDCVPSVLIGRRAQDLC